MKRILVTGGTGLVGGAVVRRFLDGGAAVTLATSTPGVRSRHPALTVVPFDLGWEAPPQALLDTLAGCRAVVHAAALLPSGGLLRTPEGALHLYRLNAVGTLALMEAACRVGMDAFVFVSTINLFGLSASTIDETTAPSPPDVYALSKLAGEEAAALFDRRGGTAFASLRISAPYGPRYRIRSVLPLFVENALAGRPLRLLGTGNRSQVFTHVDDIAAACAACIERRARGVFNVAGPGPVTMRALAETVIAALPDRGSRIEWSGDPDPDEGRIRSIDLSRARAELGFVPAFDVAAGVRALADAIAAPPALPYVVAPP